MRISVLTKIVLAAAAALILIPDTPAQAQRYRGGRNSVVGTIGDMPDSKFRAQTRRSFDRFSTRGLFGGSEFLFEPFDRRIFVYPMPVFSDAGHDFTGKSFDEYLNIVAGSYGLTNAGDYLFRFQVHNAFTIEFDYVPTFDEVLNVHQTDFLAGGGYLPIPGDPTIPTDPDDLPKPFEPIEPIFTQPLIPRDTADQDTGDAGTTVDVVETAALAADIAATLDDPATAQALLDAVAPASASQAAQQAPAVAVVPEPASLALITLGAAGVLSRARRR